jgi:hypothetical protein
MELLKRTEMELKEVNFQLNRLEFEETTLEAIFGDYQPYSNHSTEKEFLWKKKGELLDQKEILLRRLDKQIDDRKRQIDSLEQSNVPENGEIMATVNKLMNEIETLTKIIRKMEKSGGAYECFI